MQRFVPQMRLARETSAPHLLHRCSHRLRDRNYKRMGSTRVSFIWHISSTFGILWRYAANIEHKTIDPAHKYCEPLAKCLHVSEHDFADSGKTFAIRGFVTVVHRLSPAPRDETAGAPPSARSCFCA
jgi:hypothetical protein